MRFVVFMIISLFSAFAYEDFVKRAYYDSYNYEKMGDYEDAIKSLMPVLEKYPKSYTPNLRLGWLYYLSGKYKNALYHYQKAVVAIKSAVLPRLGIAYIYLLQSRFKEALSICNDILTTDYYNYYANLYAAKALLGKGDLDNCEAISLKMLALYPTDVKFLEVLGELYIKRGRIEEAKKVFEDILILDPKNLKAYDFFQNRIKSK